MKNRSKFYLTPDDIKKNETVELRQKKSPSGDSSVLGKSGKFWSIQEQGLFKCKYCTLVSRIEDPVHVFFSTLFPQPVCLI